MEEGMRLQSRSACSHKIGLLRGHRHKGKPISIPPCGLHVDYRHNCAIYAPIDPWSTPQQNQRLLPLSALLLAHFLHIVHANPAFHNCHIPSQAHTALQKALRRLIWLAHYAVGSIARHARPMPATATSAVLPAAYTLQFCFKAPVNFTGRSTAVQFQSVLKR